MGKREDRTWELKFLETLREVPIISEAAYVAGVTVRTVNKRRQKYSTFADAVEDAQRTGLRHLEVKANSVALEGNTDMIKWLLSRKLPEEYGDPTAKQDIQVQLAPVKAELDLSQDALAVVKALGIHEDPGE